MQEDILIGNSMGVNKCVQEYLASVEYKAVTVYSSGDRVQNNVGKWHEKSAHLILWILLGISVFLFVSNFGTGERVGKAASTENFRYQCCGYTLVTELMEKKTLSYKDITRIKKGA